MIALALLLLGVSQRCDSVPCKVQLGITARVEQIAQVDVSQIELFPGTWYVRAQVIPGEAREYIVTRARAGGGLSFDFSDGRIVAYADGVFVYPWARLAGP